MKISAQEFDDAMALLHFGPSGNTLEESVQVCKWLVEAGVDAIHVSTGSFFPHPRNPRGVDLPVEDLVKSYDTMISSGERTFANFLLFNGARAARAPAVERGRRSAGPDRRQEPARRARDQGGGQRPGDLHRRVPDRLGHQQGDRDAATATRSARRGR